MERSRRIPSAYGAALAVLLLAGWLGGPGRAAAQTAPSPEEIAAYGGLHAAAAKGDVPLIERWIRAGASLDSRDSSRRTPLMVAVYARHTAAVEALIKAGADVNAFDNARYDALTIAAVANDLAMVKLLLASRANAKAITSPYDGTALIASAHLGHVDVVKALIAAKAPLDHINNLGWTALIEAIVLGDGGKRHTEVVKALIAAGANLNIPDKSGTRPLKLARDRGHTEIAKLLEAAGARP
jgi:ankyrin repeat protein